MRYHALATDYDGTIASQGLVPEATLDVLRGFRETGRRLILVTGRELADLFKVFPHQHLFHEIVAENGALLYTPQTGEERVLASAPSQAFVDLLRARGVTPLSIGHVIVATNELNETTVLQVVRELGLEMQLIFNKGALMVLPSGVNKATGLSAALKAMGVSPHNVAGIGDAENDHSFLELCALSGAVANALPALKERADLVTFGSHGAGVEEFIQLLIADHVPLKDRRVPQESSLQANGEIAPKEAPPALGLR